MFLLRPSKTANQLFGFILAVVARRYGIRLHALCVLSNHFHCVLTDPKGKLPAFERDLDALVARSFNALHRRVEYFWAPGSYSAVSLLTPRDVLEKMAYVLANPVAAGLVRTGTEWPGLWLGPSRVERKPINIARPKWFFREEGPLPQTVDLELVCPPGFDSEATLARQLAQAVKRLEDEALDRLASQGRSPLGARRVLAQDPRARPRSIEAARPLRPLVACHDRELRRAALSRLKLFQARYREAWRAFARGLRRAVFPHGTYWMRVTYAARCAPA
jgi:REP element-mobilizing transposase RayT